MKIKVCLTVILTITAIVTAPPSLRAQRPRPAPSQTPFEMPDVNKLYSQMVTGMFTESIKPERAAQLAHFQKLYYDALIKEGFSKQDALEIVKASSFGAGR